MYTPLIMYIQLLLTYLPTYLLNTSLRTQDEKRFTK